MASPLDVEEKGFPVHSLEVVVVVVAAVVVVVVAAVVVVVDIEVGPWSAETDALHLSDGGERFLPSQLVNISFAQFPHNVTRVNPICTGGKGGGAFDGIFQSLNLIDVSNIVADITAILYYDVLV